MKKKSPRSIADFSSKGSKSLPIDKNLRVKLAKPNFGQPRIKPPATSSKNGRRGG